MQVLDKKENSRHRHVQEKWTHAPVSTMPGQTMSIQNEQVCTILKEKKGTHIDKRREE